MSPSSQARMAAPLFTGEIFERVVALLIALITVIAALIGYLITDADAQSGTALRLAQQYVMQAIGQRSRGEIATGYAVSDAYRMWLELDSLARLADNGSATEAATRYRQARDRVVDLTPLLQEPYFDPDSGNWPAISAYEADTYLIEITALTERFSSAFTISDAWGAKSGDYTLHLTLLTISLFLYGLSVTISNQVRWLFVGIGTLLTTITIVWSILVILDPVPILSESAIVAYARGVGLAYQHADSDAVAAFDEAIAIAPDYANAYYQRANASYRLGNYDAAVADFLLARAAGREDANLAWNLGWTYYRLGRFAEAEEATLQALDEQPDQVALHFNIGLARLAAGDLDGARAAYELGTGLAVAQVQEARAADEEPPSSLWWYLSTAATDLNDLYDCAGPSAACDDAPPRSTLAAPDTIAPAASDLTRRLKSLTVGLEYLGEPPATTTIASLGALQFARGILDPSGKLLGYDAMLSRGSDLRFGTVQENQSEFDTAGLMSAPAEDNNPIYTLFEFSGMRDVSLLVLKVFHDDQELPGLRLTQAWALGDSGNAALPITPRDGYSLIPGDYLVEIYADAQLVQQGTVTIPAAHDTAPTPQP